MGKQWARQESKRNEVAESVGTAVGWVQANRQMAGGAAAAAVAVILVAGGAWARISSLRRDAWEKLAIAQSYAYQGQAQAAQDQLKSVMESAGQPAGYATLFAGDLHFRVGQFKDAADTYQKVVDRGMPKTLVPIALANVALAQEAGGDCKASVETSQRFIDAYQDHFMAPQAHASMARCLSALGQVQQAKSTLDRIVLLYPDSYWAQWSKQRLSPQAPSPAAAKAPPAAQSP